MSEQESSAVHKGGHDSTRLLTMICDVQGNRIGKAIVRNVSGNGMLVEGDFALKPGQIARFPLHNIGELSGEVMRTEHNQTGIRFHREIDPMAISRSVD